MMFSKGTIIQLTIHDYDDRKREGPYFVVVQLNRNVSNRGDYVYGTVLHSNNAHMFGKTGGLLEHGPGAGSKVNHFYSVKNLGTNTSTFNTLYGTKNNT